MADFSLSGLGEIYDLYAPKISRYIYHRLGDQALAEDLTSEVFVHFLCSRTSPDNLSAFLYRIAHNLIVGYLRRHPACLPLDEQLIAEQGDPERHAEMELERTRLRRLLTRLTPEQQQVIVLKFLGGLSNAEVGEVLGKPESAVKALQHRALENLRGMLAAEAPRSRQLELVGQMK
ncbi:MAG: sigma-70 family RNA polymerase sigma factor [Chloroflexi bacterium]|nr:sigma-70 family RNA polymerase sigma factor [Chloroflexota bacterium]